MRSLSCMRYRDRREAGRVLGERLAGIAGQPDLLVDDGLATGSTMRAAVRALRQERAGRIIVAVPVAAPSVCAEMKAEADEVVCAATPEPFRAVGLWYDDFAQTSDAEVRELLDGAPEGGRPVEGGASWTRASTRPS